MTTLMRWSPFREWTGLSRLFDEDFFKPIWSWDRPFVAWERPYRTEYYPRVDMYSTPDYVWVKATLPGYRPDDVKIDITGNTLTISGEYKGDEEVKREDYYLCERSYGSFKREITLPSGLKTDATEASFEHGILTIRLPKAEEVKPRRIEVKAKALVEGATTS